jgi:hypothetical protein
MRFPTVIAVVAAVVTAAASGSAGVGPPAPLTWAPPALSNPVVITVTNANRRLYLDNSRDYRLNIVEHLKRELWIEGGRNIVVIGGHITIDQLGSSSSYQDNTAVKVRYGDPAGTVHLEGLLIDGAYVNDGIVTATGRNLQIQNVRVERAYDMIKNGHADCFQSQLGVGHLRVDRFTCSTQRQGFFLGDHDGPIGSADLRRVDLRGSPGTHLFWQTSPSFPVALTDVRLAIAADFTAWAPFGYWVYPQRDGRTSAGRIDRQRRAVVSRDGKRLWFVGSRISGVIRKAPVAGGEFVPAGSVGMSYVSPGYAAVVGRGS